MFLAHPLAGARDCADLEDLLEWLQPEGLDGMEVFHKPYSRETQQALLDVALRRHLLCIAGSDFHGVHHSDGATPGVDMPLVHWKEFLAAMDYGGPRDSLSRQIRQARDIEGDSVENGGASESQDCSLETVAASCSG